MTWVEREYSFRAIGGTTTLTFQSTTIANGPCGPALDRVRMTETLAVPADCKKGGWRELRDHRGVRFNNQGDCVSYISTQRRNLAAGD